MRQAAKRKAGGRKGAVSEIQNDEVMAQSTQEEIQKENDKTEDKKKGARRGGGGKRKRITSMETENNDGKKLDQRPKRARATKSREEEQIEYFEEKRNMEDLWKTAFPVGIEWDLFDELYSFNWDFKHLQEAFEEGGILHGKKKVFVFVHPEPQFIHYRDVVKIVNIPTVVVVESPFPPSDKLVLTSVTSASEKIIPMKEMKMEWVPYFPLEKRDREIDRMNFHIVCLVCTQRRAALRHLKEDRVMKFQYCLPYFYQPFEEDEVENSTVVHMFFPSETPDFVDDMIEKEEISAEQKDEFKQVRAAKKAFREAKAARVKAIEEMSEDTKETIQNIKFYKFYPQPSPGAAGILKSLHFDECSLLQRSVYRTLTGTTGKLIKLYDNGTIRTQNSFSW